jgi:C4-type Zn-finger protein
MFGLIQRRLTMTTYIDNAKVSTNKDILVAAAKAGYRFNNVRAACPTCNLKVRYSALKLCKGVETVYACACGYRRKDVQDGNKVVIDKRNVLVAKAKKATTKPKKASTRSKAKEMTNPGMPIDM